MGQHGDHHLGLVLEALDEQGADRAVDQAGDQGLLLARTAFTLEEATGDLARGEGLLLIVNGKGKEIEAGLGLLGVDDGGQDGGLAVGGEDGAVGLAGHAPGLEGQRLAGPLYGLSLDIEHFQYLSLGPKGPFPSGADRCGSA